MNKVLPTKRLPMLIRKPLDSKNSNSIIPITTKISQDIGVPNEDNITTQVEIPFNVSRSKIDGEINLKVNQSLPVSNSAIHKKFPKIRNFGNNNEEQDPHEHQHHHQHHHYIFLGGKDKN